MSIKEKELEIKKIEVRGKWDEVRIHEWSKLAIAVGVILVLIVSIIVLHSK